jgi:predicted alpha/beta superfamily hydrolase
MESTLKSVIARILTFIAIVGVSSGNADETHDVYQKTGAIGHPVIQSFKVEAASLKQTRELLVSLPSAYIESGSRLKYPVIFVLDAELMFYPIAGQVYFQGMNSQMPEAIVVGIPNLQGKRRDITPTPLNRNGEPLWFGGKQEQYLQFIENDVIPFIEKKFNVANYRVLVGLSPTGQFALHSAWAAPDLFDAHIAINTADFKAVGYDNNSVLDKIATAVELNPQQKRHLYISMPQSGGGQNPLIVEGYKKFESALKSIDNHNVEYKQEFTENNGYAAVLPAVTSALQFIFPPKLWDPNYRDFMSEEPGQTLRNIKSYYKSMSEKYGFEAMPKGERYYNRNRLKRIGYVMLEQSRTEEAIEIFEYWCSLYPHSSNAFDSLADALTRKGDLNKASQMRQKAKALAVQNEDYRLELF